jgi:hypothetical protein
MYGCLPDILLSYPDEAIGIANVNLEMYFPLDNWANVSVINGRGDQSLMVP